MATSKRVVSVSVKRSKRDRAPKIRTVLNESTVASVASGEAMEARSDHPALAVTPRRPYSENLPMYDESDRDYVNNNMEAAVALLDRANDRTVTDGIGVVRLDPALLDMLRGYVDTIRKVYPDVWDVPSWDAPWECIPPGIPGLETALLRDVKVAAEFCHAIGGIAGAAAMMDLTPCMLIDNLRL